MELIQIWYTVFSIIITAVVGYALKKIPRWYKHYKGNRDQWRVFLQHSIDHLKNEVGEVKMQNEHLKKDVSDVRYQVYPNGGNSLMDQVTRNTGILAQLVTGQRNTREILDVINWESDSDGKVVYVSAELCNILECTPEKVLGTSWVGLIVSEDRRRIYDSWKQSIETASMFKEAFTFRGCNEALVKVNAIAIHNKDKAGKLMSSLVRFSIIEN